MSHFTVAVIHDKSEDIDAILAPYDEALEVPHEISKAELISDGKARIQRIKDGCYAEYLKDPVAYLADSTPGHAKYITEKVPKMLEWTDDIIYKEELTYYGEDQLTPAGNIFSKANPNMKWDYFTRDEPNQKILFSKTTKKMSSSLEFGDIDFEMMKRISKKERKTLFKKLVANYSDNPKFLQDRYDINPGTTAEEFVNARNHQFVTFAIIIDGIWHAEGMMGWFGSVSKPKSPQIWDNEFADLIKSIKPNKIMTIVDCHI